jgi:hypothetical protein
LKQPLDFCADSGRAFAGAISETETSEFHMETRYGRCVLVPKTKINGASETPTARMSTTRSRSRDRSLVIHSGRMPVSSSSHEGGGKPPP